MTGALNCMCIRLFFLVLVQGMFLFAGTVLAQNKVMKEYSLKSLIPLSQEIKVKIRTENFEDVINALNKYNISTLNYKELKCLCKTEAKLSANSITTSAFDIELIGSECFDLIKKKYDIKILPPIKSITKSRLDTLLALDQKYREKINEFIFSSKKDSADFYFKKQDVFDVQNIFELRTVTMEKDYPNIYSIGYEINPMILILHSSLEDNLFFLSILKNQSEKRLVNWEDAMYVYQNMLFRFSHDFYNGLHGVVLDNNGNLDWEESFFYVYSLAHFLSNNNFGVKIFPNSYYTPGTQSNNNLEDIKKNIALFGVDKTKIQIINSPPESVQSLLKDQKNPFIIQFQRIKK